MTVRSQQASCELMRTILNNRNLFGLVLALPAIGLMLGYWRGQIDTMDMIHPTGEWSARLMILAMIISPLAAVLGPQAWLLWLALRRRWIGVAAFAYAVLHLSFYLIEMGNLEDILAELPAPGIWTGWAALLLMLPLALTSNDAAMRRLKAGWKRVQRLAYPSAVLVLLHWIWVHNSFTAALLHFIPLALLTLMRLAKPLIRPLKAQGV